MTLNSASFSPAASASRFVSLLLAGRVHLLGRRRGQRFVNERGQVFRVFRAIQVDALPGQPENAGAVFIPHFHVRAMPWRINILFSWLPIPFFAGLPGFRSKCWLVDEASGDFSGYYEWDSVEDARMYAASFAMRFMMARSVTESVWQQIYPGDQAPAPPG